MTQAEFQRHLADTVTANAAANSFACGAGISNCLVSRTMSGLAEPNAAVSTVLGFANRVAFVPEESHLDRYRRIWS